MNPYKRTKWNDWLVPHLSPSFYSKTIDLRTNSSKQHPAAMFFFSHCLFISLCWSRIARDSSSRSTLAPYVLSGLAPLPTFNVYEAKLLLLELFKLLPKASNHSKPSNPIGDYVNYFSIRFFLIQRQILCFSRYDSWFSTVHPSSTWNVSTRLTYERRLTRYQILDRAFWVNRVCTIALDSCCLAQCLRRRVIPLSFEMVYVG